MISTNAVSASIMYTNNFGSNNGISICCRRDQRTFAGYNKTNSINRIPSVGEKSWTPWSPYHQGNNNGDKWGSARWNDLLLMVNENCFVFACRGGCPLDPPSVGDVTGHSPFVFFKNSFLAKKIVLAGLNSQFPKFLFPPRLIPMCPYMIQTKTLALKVCCGHLSLPSSGPSLPLFTQEPQTVPLVSKIEILGTKVLRGFYTNYLGILRWPV